MKQNIIMVIVLLILFLFGLVIYDFSDELDGKVKDQTWYKIEDSKMTVLSFTDRKFSYYYQLSEDPVEPFKLCNTFRYNRSINVVKLNCHIKENKLYIATTDEEKLTITINSDEKNFYSSEKEARKADFIIKNNLNEEDYVGLMDITLKEFKVISAEELIEIYNNEETKLLALVTKEATIQNALNIRALDNLSQSTSTELLVLDTDKLTEDEINNLSKIKIDIPLIKEDINKQISIYNLGDKKIDHFTGIEVKTYSEISDYEIEDN